LEVQGSGFGGSGFRVQDSGFGGSGFRVWRFKVQGSKVQGLRTANIECRMLNECILSIIKKTERSDSILRNSAVRYSIFCGSLFNQARTAAALTPETFLNLTSEPLNAEP
jgi:hypothetical protein